MGRLRKPWLPVLVLVTLLIAGVGIWQRDFLTARYHAWRLRSATPDLHAAYVRKMEALGPTGADALLQLFQSDDQAACDNAAAVLSKILQIWTPSDQGELVLQQMAQSISKFSPAGVAACLQVVTSLLSDAEFSPALANLVVKLASQANGRAQSPHLSLAMYQMLNQEGKATESQVSAARNCVLNGLKNDDAAVRLAAIRLAVHPSLQMHEHLVPLVSGATCDNNASVRQLVLLALGEHEKLLPTDVVCRFLCDRDGEVAAICERALRIRGMSPTQVKLAKMLHDPDPAIRAELPSLVLGASELDTQQWMERLSRDGSPAVRAASAKAMGPLREERLQSLLQQLCETDEDATVRRIADYYWKR